MFFKICTYSALKCETAAADHSWKVSSRRKSICLVFNLGSMLFMEIVCSGSVCIGVGFLGLFLGFFFPSFFCYIFRRA